MANSIGDFFEALPDREEALEGIALHVRKFWEPRMVAQMRGIVESAGPSLSPLVREALSRHLFATSDDRR